MLHYVWEAQKAIFTSQDIAQVLDRGIFVVEAIDRFHGCVFALFIRKIDAFLYLLPEEKVGIGDIFTGIVVKC